MLVLIKKGKKERKTSSINLYLDSIVILLMSLMGRRLIGWLVVGWWLVDLNGEIKIVQCLLPCVFKAHIN